MSAMFMRPIHNNRYVQSKTAIKLNLRILGLVCMLGLFASLFGCNNKTEYPFDKEKAFYYSRQGVIAGGSFHLTFEPEQIVECYSYVKPVPENECGMKDRGADLYFVGLKEGEVKVTFTYEYPTCEPQQETITLKVAEDLTVTKLD